MYKVGPLVIEIQNLYNSQPLERLAVFYIFAHQHDIIYNVVYEKKLSIPLDNNIIYYSSEIAVRAIGNTKQYYHIYNQKPYAIVEEYLSNHYNIRVLEEILTQKLHPYFLPELLHLERGLIQKNSFVFHSAYIILANNGILFTAPSGGGKSTQAELWKKYKNAEIVNGDKSIIGKENGKWYAYGIPFSGSSEYCLNRTCPLKAIVILDKGPLNTLIPVGIRGFSNVFSQVTVNPWDKEFCNKAMDLVMDVCNEVPIYYYSCTKTPEAVEVLYQEFIEKGILNGSV